MIRIGRFAPLSLLIALVAVVAPAAAAPPVVVPAAAPAVVNRGDSVLLTVAIAPGTPAGIIVVDADLSSIGGSATTRFSDSGTDGDVVAGDRVFSRRVTVPSDTFFGARQLPVFLAYDFGLSDFGSVGTSIALMVGVPPAITGAAAIPSTVGIGESVLLTVTVPQRPGIEIVLVEADLGSGDLSGNTIVQLHDNGQGGDAVAGDRVFSSRQTIRTTAIEGPHTIPVSVWDTAGAASTTIPLTVVAPPAVPSVVVVVTPTALEPQTWARIVAGVTPGTGPRSTGIVVTMDLSRFGLSSNARLADTGAGSCDLAAGDGIYSACFVVPRNVALGTLTLTGQVADAQGRVVPFIVPAAIAASGDNDGDGLTNACETLFGLNPDSAAGDDGGAADPDGDGLSNAQECAAETHPRGRFRRYLAEGAANDFFRTRIALFNPGDVPARALVRVQPEGQPEQRVTIEIPVRSVRHLMPEDLRLLAEGAFSTVIESDVEVVVDRTMVWGPGDYGGHAETAVHVPSTSWFFAEGATGWRFSLFYLLQNPGDAAADVQVNYLRGPGEPALSRVYTVPPHSRRTIPVDEEEFPAGSGQKPLATTDVAAQIEVVNGVPIVAERAMYMSPDGQPFGAGHAAAGAVAAGPRWLFAAGESGAYFDEYLLIANPGSAPAHVQIAFTSAQVSGGRIETFEVPGNTRHTVYVDQLFGITSMSSSAAITSDAPIVAERAMWWPMQGESWREASVSLGATAPAPRWGIAGLEVGGPDDVHSYVHISGTRATLKVYTPYADAPVVCGLFTGSFATFHINACPGLIGYRFVAAVVEGDPDTVVEWSTYSGDPNGAGGGAFASPLP